MVYADYSVNLALDVYLRNVSFNYVRVTFVYPCVIRYATSVFCACNFSVRLCTDYYASWNQAYSSYAEEMYPFGPTYCDNNATIGQKSTGLNVNANNISIPFYGARYRSVMVGIIVVQYIILKAACIC